MARPRTKPKHIHGKATGYTLQPDGSIQVCPMYREGMDNSIAEEDAIHRQLQIVTAITHERLTACRKARSAFWNRIVDDLGLDMSKPYQYRNGVIFLKQESEEKIKE